MPAPAFMPAFPVSARSRHDLRASTSSFCYRVPTRPRVRSARRLIVAQLHNGAHGLPDLADIAVILLAGGSGKRMKADRPKQLLELAGKTVLEHSINLFGHMPEVSDLILVLDHKYRPMFEQFANTVPCRVCFADPGLERQHSVFNGLSLVPDGTPLACVHDAARPLVTPANIREVLHDAAKHGAAVLGVPSKATIKESEDGQFVLRTIPRSRLWEIQTPQVVRPDLLRKGFEKVLSEGLAVTDDVSIIEHLGQPVKITMGEYTNIKLTTPEDMDIAESILKTRKMTKTVSASSS